MKEKPRKPSVYRFEVVRHLVYEPNQTIHTPADMRQYFSFLEHYDREKTRLYIDFYRFLLIFIDFHIFSLIFHNRNHQKPHLKL